MKSTRGCNIICSKRQQTEVTSTSKCSKVTFRFQHVLNMSPIKPHMISRSFIMVFRTKKTCLDTNLLSVFEPCPHRSSWMYFINEPKHPILPRRFFLRSSFDKHHPKQSQVLKPKRTTRRRTVRGTSSVRPRTTEASTSLGIRCAKRSMWGPVLWQICFEGLFLSQRTRQHH